MEVPAMYDSDMCRLCIIEATYTSLDLVGCGIIADVYQVKGSVPR